MLTWTSLLGYCSSECWGIPGILCLASIAYVAKVSLTMMIAGSKEWEICWHLFILKRKTNSKNKQTNKQTNKRATDAFEELKVSGESRFLRYEMLDRYEIPFRNIFQSFDYESIELKYGVRSDLVVYLIHLFFSFFSRDLSCSSPVSVNKSNENVR